MNLKQTREGVVGPMNQPVGEGMSKCNLSQEKDDVQHETWGDINTGGFHLLR